MREIRGDCFILPITSAIRYSTNFGNTRKAIGMIPSLGSSYHRWRRTVRSDGDPGIVRRGAADHHGVAAGFAQHAHGVRWRVDVAVADHPHAHSLLLVANHVPVGAARVTLRACTRITAIPSTPICSARRATPRPRCCFLSHPARILIVIGFLRRSAPREGLVPAPLNHAVNPRPPHLTTFLAGHPRLTSTMSKPSASTIPAARPITSASAPKSWPVMGCSSGAKNR